MTAGVGRAQFGMLTQRLGCGEADMTTTRLLAATLLLAVASSANAARKAAEPRPSSALITRIERKLETGWNFGTPFRKLVRFYAFSPDRKQVGGAISITSGTGPNRWRGDFPSEATEWRPGSYTVRWKRWPSYLSEKPDSCFYAFFLYDIKADRFVQPPCAPLPRPRRPAQ
jgi:hypothetical protein